jgi:two-component system, LytTR family, response regulator
VKAYRVLVADDEAPARSKIVRLLSRDERFELVGEANDGRVALEKITSLRPDLVVLDVQMPGLSGFEVLDAIGADACPEIIFSTAFDAFALKAFEAHALDYLLKPYDAGRFQAALDRAATQLDRSAAHAGVMRSLLGGLAEGGALTRVVIRCGDAWLPIELARVSHVRAEGKHLRIQTIDGPHLVRQPLRTLEARLDPRHFVRIHRGDIVNVDHVARLEPGSHGDGIVVMKDGSALVLSRTHRFEFLRRWGADAGTYRSP